MVGYGRTSKPDASDPRYCWPNPSLNSFNTANFCAGLPMSRTEYDVCLVVSSEHVGLEELSSRIGVPPSSGAHSIGEQHRLRSRGKWKSTVWQLCSRREQADEIEAHLEDIARQLPATRLAAPGVLPDDARILLSLGVFSDRQIPVAELTRECLRIADDYRASVEIRFYTPEMGDKPVN